MCKIKALCQNCQLDTNHVILKEHKTSGDSCDGEVQWWDNYQIIQCLGCDDVSFRHLSACTEIYDPHSGDLKEHVDIYPNPCAGRQPMLGHEGLPIRTSRIYLETERALNSQMPILTAIGLRTLIESICLEQKTKTDILARQIDELSGMGLLSTKQAEYLHSLRFMGNDATHEIIAPPPRHLISALDIAETLLKAIYILPNIAGELQKSPTIPKA